MPFVPQTQHIDPAILDSRKPDASREAEFMPDRLIWERDGACWPNRDASRFVTASRIRWHVQVMGSGPALLLIHGTGASSHSWGSVAPILARQFKVVVPDLPGHGFTQLPGQDKLSLPGMAKAVADLMQALDVSPEIGAGHSAGAAILIRMTIDRLISPRCLVSVNGALMPLGGFAGQLFSPLAKILALNPVLPRVVAWRARSPTAVENLLRGTGSESPKAFVDIYARLFRTPSHVAGALGMMACWDLTSFSRDLPKLETPLVLVAADNDQTIAPKDALRAAALVQNSRVESIPGLGHLCHEERPDLVAAIIESAAFRNGMKIA
jgi:magnesium chelatase accessory protein